LRLDAGYGGHEISFSDKHLAAQLHALGGNAAASAAQGIPLLEEARLPERFTTFRGR
jgi:hypothetical protein